MTGIYELPQDLRDLRDTIRQIVTERVAPRAAEIDSSGEYPWDVRELFAEHDLMGLPFETDYGGTGTGTLMLNIAVEEVARACASSSLILMVQDLGTLPIARFGTPRAAPGVAAAMRERRVVAGVRAVGARLGLGRRLDANDRGARRR